MDGLLVLAAVGLLRSGRQTSRRLRIAVWSSRLRRVDRVREALPRKIRIFLIHLAPRHWESGSALWMVKNTPLKLTLTA